MEWIHEGSPTTTMTEARAETLVAGLLDQLRARGPLKRVLILPPDITRMHSWAGVLTGILYRHLPAAAEIAILPAIGTHVPMTPGEIEMAGAINKIPSVPFRTWEYWATRLAKRGGMPPRAAVAS